MDPYQHTENTSSNSSPVIGSGPQPPEKKRADWAPFLSTLAIAQGVIICLCIGSLVMLFISPLWGILAIGFGFPYFIPALLVIAILNVITLLLYFTLRRPHGKALVLSLTSLGISIVLTILAVLNMPYRP